VNPSKLYENHMNKAVLNDLEAIYKIAVVTSYAQMVVNSIAADLGGLHILVPGRCPV